MNIGVEVVGHHAIDRSPAANFTDVIEQTSMAAEVGLDLVWCGQHYLLEGRQKFQVVPAISRLAAESDDLYVGANILFPLHHPVEIAEQFATIDALSNGRAILGPIEGYRKEEFEAFGVDRRERAGRLEEGLEIVKRLWTEDRVSFDGEFYSLDGVSANPKPVQEPHPPIWIGANKDPAVRRAAAEGTAWLINPHDTEEVIERQLDMIDPPAGDGWHGLQPAIKDGFVAPTDELALERFEPGIREFYDWYDEAGQGEAMETPEAVDLDAAGLERFAIGSPETVADELVHLHDDFGVNCVIMYMHRPEIPQEDTVEATRLLGEEVVPLVEERIDG